MKTNRMIRTLAVLLCMVSMLGFSGMKTDVYARGLTFVVLNVYEKELNIGDEYQLYAVTSNGRKPSFRSSNSKVASVNTYGLITAKKAGSARITVKTGNGEARYIRSVCRYRNHGISRFLRGNHTAFIHRCHTPFT